MSFPWKYRTVSAGREIIGCQTGIADPDEDGNGEVSNSVLLLILCSLWHIIIHSYMISLLSKT